MTKHLYWLSKAQLAVVTYHLKIVSAQLSSISNDSIIAASFSAAAPQPL